jgi:CTP synthase
VESIIETEPKHRVRVGIVAKYMGMEDTYKSVFEAIQSAAWAHKTVVDLVWIDAEKLESEDGTLELKDLDGIIVPGGFGSRGVEGKILAADYAMRANVPYLGLCLGMQVAVIALARQVLKTKDANTTEVNESTKHPVIHLMEQQRDVAVKGGTMRLGNYPCVLAKGTHSRRVYGTGRVQERHRHRYEFNNAYRKQLEAAGLVLAGLSPDKELVEIIELKDHPYFVASQFHPEFTSWPTSPQPLFSGFIEAIINRQLTQLRPVEPLTGVRKDL